MNRLFLPSPPYWIGLKKTPFYQRSLVWILLGYSALKNGHTVAVVRASPKLTNYRQKMVVIHQRVSSIKGHLPSKGVFHQRSSSIKRHLPAKVFFHLRVPSIKGWYNSECGTAQLSLPLFSAVSDMLPSLRSSPSMTS